MRRGGRPFAQRLYGILLHLYPPGFRREYGPELRRAFRDWHRARCEGASGTAGFWVAVLRDLQRSVAAEWWVAARAWSARRRELRPSDPHPPPYGAAAVTGLVVFALYLVTLAPSIAFWDSGEYTTVAHILGIPHPPGNPLFVLLARGWETLLSPLGLPVAVRVNLFSAALSAAAHAFWFLVIDRLLAGWSGSPDIRGPRRVDVRRLAAGAAVLVSATAFTVWSQSNVNEKVYTVSLLTTALAVWLALRWRDRRSDRRLLAIVFLLALTATNHLMGVLVVPALLVFVLAVDRRPLLRGRFWIRAVPLAALALSVQLFLPLRAAQRPLVNEGAPACDSVAGAAASVYTWGATGCEALSAVLRREQYPERGILEDPNDPSLPRTPALVAAQLLNWLQYFDWQWARSVDGHTPLLGGARPLISLLFVLLGLLGARTLWRSDRSGAVLLALLFATLSVGLVVYLNFRYGYTVARDRFPDLGMHEVRERDYFFLIGFSVWGLLAGTGVVAAWRAATGLVVRMAGDGPAARLIGAFRRPGPAALLVAPVLGLALLPLALNWGWATRADDLAARDWAYNVLMSVEPYGVLVTNGDNDSFPLWYLQKVEGVREDVTIVLSPYLNTGWYAEQIRDLTRPCPPEVEPSDRPGRIVCQRPFRSDRLPAPLRRLGWADAPEPRDSILPLSDGDIARIAAGWTVTSRPVTLRAGRLRTTIPAGTPLSPADSFAAVILQTTLGDRPIHFMPGSSHLQTLGLAGHTVRHGLTWRIDDTAPDGRRVLPVPDADATPMLGAAIDLAATDTLLHDVFLRRGRLLDPDAPWVDHATTSIPLQYVYAHVAAARAHALRGDDEAVQRHLRKGEAWQAVITPG